jgi:predicted pyridoxine 5'-phosphate oxidase superfamily flavin-nucleotide-binding protein
VPVSDIKWVMELTEKQLELLSRRNLVILATANLDGEPRAIIVEINKTDKDKLVITDNEMGQTRQNLLANKKVFILAFEQDYSYCLKISGRAEYHSSGEYIDFVKKIEANKDRAPKGAVVIKIDTVIEFK